MNQAQYNEEQKENPQQKSQSQGDGNSGIIQYDDKLLDELMNQNINLKQTDIKKRQNSCTFKNIKKDELPQQFISNFKPARKLSLKEIINYNKVDEDLQKYKKNLLGEINEEEINQQEMPEVEIIKIEIVCSDRAEGNIILDFTLPDAYSKKQQYTIKENAIYKLRIFFKVKYDIVYGLKVVNNVWKSFMKVDKSEDMMGCFAPKKEIQSFDLPYEQAPSGFLERGVYKGKLMFVDNDGIVHMQFEYLCKISKSWKD